MWGRNMKAGVNVVVVLHVVIVIAQAFVVVHDGEGSKEAAAGEKGNGTAGANHGHVHEGQEHQGSHHHHQGETTEFPVLNVSNLTHSTGKPAEGQHENHHHEHEHEHGHEHGHEHEHHHTGSTTSSTTTMGTTKSTTTMAPSSTTKGPTSSTTTKEPSSTTTMATVSSTTTSTTVKPNVTREMDESSTDKIEQILWDIFVDDDDVESDDDEDDEEDSEVVSSSRLRDEDEEDDVEVVSLVGSDSDAGSTVVVVEETEQRPRVKSVQKRSTDSQTNEDHDEARSGRGNQYHPRRNGNKGSRGSSKKVSSNRGHSKSATKASKKKSSSVSKYNEYMDVVLKRMNSMIKTKQMDPLMVNLFSGGAGGNTAGGNKNEQKGQKGKKNKKKKSGPAGWKKRKGAKNNKARVDDEGIVVEGRSVSSSGDEDSSDSSGTREVREEDVGVVGPGGVFIRRVGVEVEEEDEEESSDGDEENDRGGEEMRDFPGEDDEEYPDSHKSFREIRALIVNGSMRRSDAGGNGTEKAVSTTPEVEDAPRMSSAGAPVASMEDEESSRKKKTSSSGSNKGGSKKSPPKKKDEEKKKKKKGGKGAKKPKPTRGVLKGLSSLKRNGNVDVVRQNDNVRIVRGKFTLGPVTLEIVPRGKGKGKESARKKHKKKSDDDDDDDASRVTAVARELKGVIEVRLKKNSATTIKRLRVFPPSSVKIKPGVGGANKGSSSGEKAPTGPNVPRYSRVTPVATHRLRQIATAVVRQADLKRKSTGLDMEGSGKGKNKRKN